MRVALAAYRYTLRINYYSLYFLGYCVLRMCIAKKGLWGWFIILYYYWFAWVVR